MIRIAAYEPAHRSGVIDVILPIQQQEFAIPITLERQPDLLNVEDFYRSGGGNFWVALDDERVVGTIALLDIGNRQGALRKMFVRREYRGAHHGIAERLLATLLEWSEVNRIREVFLGTTAQFLAAHRFYEKHSFAQVDREQLPPAFPIMAVDTRFYFRTLPAPPP